MTAAVVRLVRRARWRARLARLERLATTLAAVSAAGCGGDGGPLIPLRPTSYALVLVDLRPLPYRFGGEGTDRYSLLADTLRLDANGRYTQVTVTRTEQPSRGVDSTARFVSDGRYERTGDALTFVFDCPINASCIAPPTGTFDGDTLLLVYRFGFEGEPYRRDIFRRVAE